MKLIDPKDVPKPTAGSNAEKKAVYDEWAAALRSGKALLLEAGELPAPESEMRTRVVMLRQVFTRRGLLVSLKSADEGVYVTLREDRRG